MPYLGDDGQLWAGLRKAQLELSLDQDYHHRGAAAVLSQHPAVEAAVREAVTGVTEVICMDRKDRRAIDPHDLNVRLRQTLDATALPWVFEAVVAPGGIILPNEHDTETKRGFDAVLCDMEANVARLWNYCFGTVHLHDGHSYWERVLAQHPELARTFALMGDPPSVGTDWYRPPASPTILVEIEFANSARRERDFFKALQASSLLPVDLFIFLSLSPADGSNKWISSGTVHHGLVVEQLREFAQAITVATWAGGIQLEVGDRIRDLTDDERVRLGRNARNPDG